MKIRNKLFHYILIIIICLTIKILFLLLTLNFVLDFYFLKYSRIVKFVESEGLFVQLKSFVFLLG